SPQNGRSVELLRKILNWSGVNRLRHSSLVRLSLGISRGPTSSPSRLKTRTRTILTPFCPAGRVALGTAERVVEPSLVEPLFVEAALALPSFVGTSLVGPSLVGLSLVEPLCQANAVASIAIVAAVNTTS